MTIVKCRNCKRERPHQAKGLCKSCYVYSIRDVEKTRERSKLWAQKNRKYFREYNRRRNKTKPENYRFKEKK